MLFNVAPNIPFNYKFKAIKIYDEDACFYYSK